MSILKEQLSLAALFIIKQIEYILRQLWTIL